MIEKHPDQDEMCEARLKELLSQLSRTPTQEANFEERFLVTFHERVMQDAVCKPARSRLWEHISFLFRATNKARLAFASTSVIAFGALTLTLSDWAVNSDSAAATASRDRVKRGMVESFESLKVNTSLFQTNDKQSNLDIQVTPVHEEDKTVYFYDDEEETYYRVNIDEIIPMPRGVVSGIKEHQLGY